MRNTTTPKRLRALGGISVIVATAMTLAACGSSDSSSDDSASGGSSADVAAFEAKIAPIAEAAEQTQTQPAPAEGPKAATGKSIVIIPPAGASTEGGYRVGLAAQDAANALGWKVTFINPEGDPAKMNAAVQQAIAIKADAIAIASIDAQVVLSSLQQAKDKGIKIVAAVAANSEGETGVFDSLVPSLQSGRDNGYALAAKAYELTDGKIRDVQMMDSEFGYVVARQEGWKQFIKECAAAGGDCKTVNTTNFLAADITTKLPTLTGQALRSNSDFNVLWQGFDSGLTFSIQGAKQAGLAKEGTFGVGFDGNTPNLDDIRKDGYQKATVGLSTLAIGYAMIDNANRLLQGEEPLTGEEQGIVNKLLTKDNVPKKGKWWGDQDVRETYWKVWGVTPTDPAPASDL